MMTPKIQSVRGMNDILPDEAEFWERFEEIIRSWLKSYAYRPIRLPIVEPTPLFKRAIGEVTDIVEKEMYSFIDSLNGELADAASRGHRRLRARGDSAQSDRAAAAASLLHGPDVPPRAATERALSPVLPGRRRSVRFPGPDIDAEQILMGARLWDDLGLDGIALQLNTLGQAASVQRIVPS
jgi:histidyl-tRNA synthetase